MNLAFLCCEGIQEVRQPGEASGAFVYRTRRCGLLYGFLPTIHVAAMESTQTNHLNRKKNAMPSSMLARVLRV